MNTITIYDCCYVIGVVVTTVKSLTYADSMPGFVPCLGWTDNKGNWHCSQWRPVWCL